MDLLVLIGHWAGIYFYVTVPQNLTVCFAFHQSTSDGGNGNHRASLPIILIKIKVDQMLPSLYISSLLVSILCFLYYAYRK